MPLHCNESSQQRTISLKGEDTFVKENYMLSCERVTVLRSVKKRIITRTNINKQRDNKANTNENGNTSALINIAQEDDSNIFELLQNL